ncbi:MAG: hypothetical protein CMM46_11100 [Rhodospirillaceae bacterium]|nr:hypothetical protein [Rhodospirillaceae bacterium]|tara:strand:+ start:4264 stop:4578 length:315 start_codon:yes stop_codon:yes gene_type:complete
MLADMIVLYIDTGYRFNELRSCLNDEAHINLNLDPPTMTIYKTKNWEKVGPRTGPLTQRCVEILRDRVATTPKGAKMFTLSRRQMHHRWNVIRKDLERAEDPER